MPDLVWGLLQPALRSLDSAVTVVNVLLHIAQVVEIEPPFRLLRSGSGLILRLQSFTVHLRAGSEVLLRVGEEVVRAGSNKVGAADFRVRNLKLGIATLSAGTNELVS